MHPARLVPGAVALFCLLLTLPLSARAQTTGSFVGSVRDTAGVPLADSRVLLRNAENGVAYSTDTGAEGGFGFRFMPAGRYTLLVERVGYRPLQVLEVAVLPGERRTLALTLAPGAAGEAVSRVDTLRLETLRHPLLGSSVAQWLSAEQVEGFPDARRDLRSVLRWSSRTPLERNPFFPAASSVDDFPVATVQHPALAGGTADPSPYPLSGVAAAGLLAVRADVEWSEGGAAAVEVRSGRGTRELEVRAFGGWAGDALAERGVPAAEDAAFSAAEGGVRVSGPLARERAAFAAGVEFWRSEGPDAQSWSADSLLSRVSVIARDSLGAGPLAGPPAEVRTSRVSAFGRMDWHFSPATRLDVTASIAALPSAGEGEPALRAAWAGPSFTGNDLRVGALLSSRLGSSVAQELRFSVESSARETEAALVPPTALGQAGVRGDLQIGELGFRYAGAAQRAALTRARVGGAWHFGGGAHQLKLGLDGEFSQHEQPAGPGGSAEWVFATPEDFARGSGAFSELVGSPAAAEFSTARLGAFVQDRWSPRTDVELLLGVRYDLERLPGDDVVPDAEWLARSGTSAADLGAASHRVGPRVGLRWDVGGRHAWLLQGAAGLFAGRTSAALLGEAMHRNGQLRARRGIGSFGGWPAVPGEAEAPVLGPLLAVLQPGFAAPYTIDAGGGVTRFMGGSSAVHLAAAYRRAEGLPRRADLNLAPEPTAEDQHGRPIYGTLQRQGGLLLPQNGSNRRFADYDAVHALTDDGWAEEQSVTLGVEHRPAGPLALWGSYTFSRAEDTQAGAALGLAAAELPPFPGERGRWVEGRSDFDVPHRLVLAGELAFPRLLGLRAAAIYRYESGRAFTPLALAGSDVNGDGSAWNDPAFIDPQAPGMEGLLGEWECLTSSRGRFVERNACRTDAPQYLDARLSLRLLGGERRSLELMVDGLNLLDSDSPIIDSALYRLDAEGEIERSEDGASLRLPLRANPGFGRPLARASLGRIIRFGFQVKY